MQIAERLRQRFNSEKPFSIFNMFLSREMCLKEPLISDVPQCEFLRKEKFRKNNFKNSQVTLFMLLMLHKT